MHCGEKQASGNQVRALTLCSVVDTPARNAWHSSGTYLPRSNAAIVAGEQFAGFTGATEWVTQSAEWGGNLPLPGATTSLTAFTTSPPTSELSQSKSSIFAPAPPSSLSAFSSHSQNLQFPGQATVFPTAADFARSIHIHLSTPLHLIMPPSLCNMECCYIFQM